MLYIYIANIFYLYQLSFQAETKHLKVQKIILESNLWYGRNYNFHMADSDANKFIFIYKVKKSSSGIIIHSYIQRL